MPSLLYTLDTAAAPDPAAVADLPDLVDPATVADRVAAADPTVVDDLVLARLLNFAPGLGGPGGNNCHPYFGNTTL